MHIAPRATSRLHIWRLFLGGVGRAGFFRCFGDARERARVLLFVVIYVFFELYIPAPTSQVTN